MCRQLEAYFASDIYPTSHLAGFDTRSFYCRRPCTNRDSYAAVTKIFDHVGITYFWRGPKAPSDALSIAKQVLLGWVGVRNLKTRGLFCVWYLSSLPLAGFDMKSFYQVNWLPTKSVFDTRSFYGGMGKLIRGCNKQIFGPVGWRWGRAVEYTDCISKAG